MSLIAVLDYGIGNLRSAEKALQRAGADAHLTSDPDEAAAAAAVVLPGVGAFGRCLEELRRSRLDRVALEAIESGKPFMGICVGMQMLYESSEEDDDARGLGVFPGKVVRLPAGEKHPQMQWNQIQLLRGASRLFEGCGPDPWFYFVHSYAPEMSDAVVATCDYGGDVTAAVESANVWATQFHPEKSGAAGLSLLANFASVAALAASAV
jgi:imidazole glycerol-phosphate synthase subunit HisH